MVGDARLSHEEVRSEVAGMQEQADTLGMELNMQQRASLSTQVVSQWVFWELVADAVEADGVAAGEGEADQQTLDRLADSLMTPEIEAQLADLEQQVRQSYLDQGEAAGLRGEELERQVDQAMEAQADQLRAQVLQPVVDERIAEQLDRTDIDISRRYGTFDEQLPGIVPGANPLSPQANLDEGPPDGGGY